MGCTSSNAAASSASPEKAGVVQLTETDSAASTVGVATSTATQLDNATATAANTATHTVPVEHAKAVVVVESKENKAAAVVEQGTKTIKQPETAPSVSATPQPQPQPVSTPPSSNLQNTQGTPSVSATKPILSLPPLKKGFILKEGHLIKNWKNRFFVLEAGTMTYYESSTDSYPFGVRKKGEIILKGTTLKVEGNIIAISYDGDVTSREGLSKLTLEIRYPTERDEWFQAIRSHIAYFNAADLS